MYTPVNTTVPFQHPSIQRGPFARTYDILNHLRANMYFTLLFEKEEGPTEIYELCFHPAVVWMKDGEEICQPHLGPHFVAGDFTYLLNHAGIVREVTDHNQQNPRPRKIGIVCHDSGHGIEDDLNLMMTEMKSEGFMPQLMFRN